MGDRKEMPLPSQFENIVVVLVRTSHSGNLGAISRSMLNFGFSNLRMIDIQCKIDEEARKRAKHAGSILDNVDFFEDWDSCMKDIGLVIGTSGKREHGQKIIFRHFIMPWDLAEKAKANAQKIAIVFGEEGMGLTTEELGLCDLLMTLPTWEGYPICNLSHSVTVVLYELQRYRVRNDFIETPLLESHNLQQEITPEMRRMLRQAFLDWGDSLEGESERKKSVRDTLTRVVMRGSPSEHESEHLIGAFVEATSALNYAKKDPRWMRNRRRRIESFEEE